MDTKPVTVNVGRDEVAMERWDRDADGRWFHWMVTYGVGDRAATVYLDGAEQAKNGRR